MEKNRYARHDEGETENQGQILTKVVQVFTLDIKVGQLLQQQSNLPAKKWWQFGKLKKKEAKLQQNYILAFIM